MAAVSRRLFIPAARIAPRDNLRYVTPWFLRDVQTDLKERPGPQLLTFTQTDFVEAFFDGVQQAGENSEGYVFEELIPYRDYAEPPSGMMDVRGETLYPKTIRRLEPPAFASANTVDEEGEFDEDGVPTGEPPWLRKLYLPLHQHFHIVTTEIVCKRRGYPSVAKERLLESGMIVRRLVPDPERERWEDWVPCTNGDGLWLEIADRDMRLLNINNENPPPLDPAAIPNEAYGDTDAQMRLRARLGLSVGDTLPSALSPHGLSPIPSSIGDAKAHTALYGYLPVQSSEHVLPDISADALELELQDLGAQFARRAHRHLGAEFLGNSEFSEEEISEGMESHVGDMRRRIQVSLEKLLEVTDSLGGSLSDQIVDALENLRSSRISLANDMYAGLFPDETTPRVDETDETVTVSSLSDELTAWLDAELERENKPVPWPPLGLDESDERILAHRAAAALEKILGDIDERGAGAGSAYGEVLQEMVDEPRREALLREGLDVHEQPVRGLLVFPGHSPSVESIVELIKEVEERYHPDSGTGSVDEQALATVRNRAEADARLNTVLPRYDSDSLYAVWCYVRVAGRDPCEEELLVWTRPSDVFSLAEPTDILGLRPVAIQMPDLKKLVRDLPRIPKARAIPFAAVHTPPDSDVETGEEVEDVSRKWGVAWICSYGIPVFTICAWVLFKIILAILMLIPGFGWLLRLKFCIPIPSKK